MNRLYSILVVIACITGFILSLESFTFTLIRLFTFVVSHPIPPKLNLYFIYVGSLFLPSMLLILFIKYNYSLDVIVTLDEESIDKDE